MNTCRSCGATILWATTTNGKAMPIDAEPSPDGNVELTEWAPGRYRCTVHPQTPFDAPPLHMPHHATCPHADEWRRK